jgi:hypothetical protein
MRRSLSLLLIACLTASVPLAAQGARTISPGMSRAQVIAALGQPLTLREADGYTYIFYRNQCTRACGMNDLVVLRADSVVDAIFRSSDRRYTGESSSPQAIPASVARRGNAAAAAAPAPRMRPAPPSDARPSIPVNPPKLTPAPSAAPTKPAAQTTKPAPTTP